jgi:hypothetical protein
MYSSQLELNETGLKHRTKEADQHKKELKEKPNTPKKANTGSTKLPLPSATQLYWKRKVKTNSTPKPPPIYVTDVKNISPLIQLLERIAKQQKFSQTVG